MSNTQINPLSMMATSSLANTSSAHHVGSKKGSTSWYEAMAEAWGKTLDAKADEITAASDKLANGGDDTPSNITMITTLAQQMNFMSNSAHTSLQSVGSALETMARKQ